MEDKIAELSKEISYIPIVRLEEIQALLQEHLPAFISNPKQYGHILDAKNKLELAIDLLHKAEESLADIIN